MTGGSVTDTRCDTCREQDEQLGRGRERLNLPQQQSAMPTCGSAVCGVPLPAAALVHMLLHLPPVLIAVLIMLSSIPEEVWGGCDLSEK